MTTQQVLESNGRTTARAPSCFFDKVARLQATDQADLAINGEAVLRDLDVSANQTRAVWMCLDVDGAMAS